MRFAIAFAIALSGAALLAGRVAAAPVQAQQGEPKRTVEAGATLELHVTCADGKAVPRGVEVRVVAMGEFGDLAELAPARGASFDRVRFEAALADARSFGVREGAAAVAVPRPGGPIVVVASAPARYAERLVTPDEAGPVELSLQEDRSLAVRVVDGRGRPVARVPVAIAGFVTDGPIPDVLLDPRTTFRAVAWTSEADGVALFGHVQAWISPDGYEDSIALLAVPHHDHEQVRITPTLLAEGVVELHAPSFGSVELRITGVEQAAVRLRERRPSPDADDAADPRFDADEWRPNEPLALDVVDGVARCDRVGIGCVLQLESRWKGLSTPFLAEFSGPDRSGAMVVWDLGANGASALAQTASLTGRLLDSSRRPIASRVLHGRIVTSQGRTGEDSAEDDAVELVDEHPAQTFTFVTDGSGRIDLSLGPRAPTNGVRRWLEFHEVAGDEEAERRGDRGWNEATDRLVPGAHDFGDVLLVGSDARDAVARRSDEALVAECEAVRTWPRDLTSRRASLDLRLNEMARRGGPRLVSFFESEIASRRAAATRAHEADLAERKAAWLRAKADAAESEEELPPPSADDEPWEFAVPLKWAALLRRAQRKPAPIAIEATAPTFEAIAPDLPAVKVWLHDVDAGFDGLNVPELDSAGWRVTVLDDEGRIVPEPEFDFWQGSKISWETDPTLRHDQSRLELVPLGRRTFEPARPGEYRVRVDYLVGDVVYLSSGDLPVRIKPIPIQVTRRDYDAMVSEIRTIDVTKPVVLTSSPIRPRDEFDGDPKSPEDAVARRGRLALPALLDELHETTDDPRRRAWILGLLWNTHLSTSITSEQIEAAVGSFEWYHFWPTIQYRSDDRNPSRLVPGNRSDPSSTPDPRFQRDLAAAWTELRAWFEIKIEE